MDDLKFHYCYKITNTINGHYYYGIHSTNNVDDDYMGSGHKLLEAFKKYGKENFAKEIIKFFKTRQEASDFEQQIVNSDLVKEDTCYNVMLGGDNCPTLGKLAVINNITHDNILISKEEYYKNKEQYTSVNQGGLAVKDKIDGSIKRVSCEEYQNNKERYETVFNGIIVCKDTDGNIIRVHRNDPKYLNGELVPLWKGKKHKEESITRLKETLKSINHQQGEKNSHYGKCWVYEEATKKTILIGKEELERYLSNGYKRGRKLKK